MPKQFLRTKVARTCAIACIFGMSANTLVVAAQSVIQTKTDSTSSSSATIVNAPKPAPTPPQGLTPGRENMTQQPDQGRQFGMAGFVGEPINLNVVNADIRDILNYITEQYGINFVIDSSVGAVPVTVNVDELDTGGRVLRRVVQFDTDEGVRFDANAEGFAKLKPAFHANGTAKMRVSACMATAYCVTATSASVVMPRPQNGSASQ